MVRKQKNNVPIRIICALLFAVFSFLYIYVFQGELLALMQDHLSKGQTTNNTFITALLVTILLMALQHLLNRAGKLHGAFEAFSYLPSCAILALMTKVDNTFSYSLAEWIIAVVVVALVFILVVWIDRNTLPSGNTKFLKQLSSNLGVMVVLFVFTGWYGNDNPGNKMELAAWKHLHAGDYDKVLTVGQRSDDYTAGLTALRNLSLAKTGQIGDKLFAYPQPYGSEGLMMSKYNKQTPAYGATEYYKMLGAMPYGGEKATAYYKRMMLKGDSVIYRDLYAAALLLDKDLDDFAALTVENGKPSGFLSVVPVHYQEAWMIYNEQHPFTPVVFEPDSIIEQRYQDYLSFREEHAENPEVLRNLCKRKFGKTYWYYYDFMR